MQLKDKYKHYHKDVSHLDSIDVYRVIDLWGLDDPCLQHALKKILACGNRGVKDQSVDVQEAIDSLVRWQNMQEEDSKVKTNCMKDDYKWKTMSELALYDSKPVSVEITPQQKLDFTEAVKSALNQAEVKREKKVNISTIVTSEDMREASDVTEKFRRLLLAAQEHNNNKRLEDSFFGKDK